MRVELFDSEGNRYTVTFEGQITRDKALRLLDLVELLGGMPNDSAHRTLENQVSESSLSRFDRLRSVIHKNFPLVWFSSRDIQSVYEQELKEPISLSTVSTYLSRMAAKVYSFEQEKATILDTKRCLQLPRRLFAHEQSDFPFLSLPLQIATTVTSQSIKRFANTLLRI